jgi:hypothetical protein
LKNYSFVSKTATSLLLIGVLAACGGGSSSDVTPSPTSTALTLSGTAATDAAISDATVEAKCATGTGSGPTSANGNYSFSIDGGKWPCLARVTAPDGTVLHTVAAGSSGTTATADITPVTQLVVASLAGTEPAAYYAAFDSTAAAAVTSTTVAAAETAVVAMLKSGGVDLTAVGDVITAPLTPSTSTSAGNTYALDLNHLMQILEPISTFGPTITRLTTTVGDTSHNTATGTPPTPIGTPSLPPDMLLRTVASNCSALRSGTYRNVFPAAGSTLAKQYGKLVVDAATLAVTFSDGSTGTWTANGPCRYSTDAGQTDIVVSQAGVIVARYTLDNGITHLLGIAFPDQTHTQAELVGNWNALGIFGNAGAYTGTAASTTIDSAGAMTAVSLCQNAATWDVKACNGVPDGQLSMKANIDGGFDFVDTGAVTGRVFGYQAGGGELMLVEIDADGTLGMYTKQRTEILPTVGVVTTAWNLSVGSLLTSTSAVAAVSNTIVSVDSTAGSWLRTQKTVGGTDDHPETLFANNPRNGYTFRAAGTATAVDGTTVTIREFTNLGLRGMGMSALLLPGLKLYMFSVNQP